jgi:hypothetical protein
VTKQQGNPLSFKFGVIIDPSSPDLQCESAGVEDLSYWNSMTLELSSSASA